MKSLDFDILVLGGGCIGSSILYELMSLGINDVGLVDYGGKSLSATSQSGGMLRVFHEDLRHLELALNNYKIIEEYRHSGIITERVNINGSLYFFENKNLIHYHDNLKKMTDAHYPFEVLNKINGEKKFPEFKWNENESAIYEPLGFQLSPNIFVNDLLENSQKFGAKIFNDFNVTHIKKYKDYFHVMCNETRITAKTLILAGGARFLPQLEELGIVLPLKNKKIMTYSAKKKGDFHILPNYFDRKILEYGCFGYDAKVILSNKRNQRMIEDFWTNPFEERSAEDCYAPGRIGYSGQISGFSNLFLATGWGGTGFKFSLEIGKRMAHTLKKGRFFEFETQC